MATMVALNPGARLWGADGLCATAVAWSGPAGLLIRFDGERSAVVVDPRNWRFALACEYCDRAAQVRLRDGQPGDVLCRACAGAHFTTPTEWVLPLGRRTVRALFAQCAPVG